jgi:beta-galactosidase/beta-glucuronidase
VNAFFWVPLSEAWSYNPAKISSSAKENSLDSDYPRPQLVRSQWMTLNGSWCFLFDPDRTFKHPSELKQWPLFINVPFPPESKASGIGDTSFHPICWYQRDVQLAPVPDGDRVLLHFGAVDYCAIVWVNGQEVARHEGGHTPFFADITSVLRDSGAQTITVLAEDDPHDLTQPRGKQDWQLEPHSTWYHRTSGIWQTVWLEIVPETHIRRIRWTPNVVGWSIQFEAKIAGFCDDDLRVQVELRHEGRLLARDIYQIIDLEADRQIILSDPGIDDFRNELLWTPERPTLIDAEIQLKRGNKTIDRVQSYTAMRSVDIDRDRFMVNGRPYTLRLVLDQGYWPDTMLAAPSDEALRRDVELAKAMGFNGVRKHQKIENPRYLYWADKLGLFVWEEMPAAYRFTRTSLKRLVREWTEAIERDYSHPCIIVWVPFNESWGVPDLPATAQQRHAVQALYHLTKMLDNTRPVVGNDGWESTATDIIGIHDYDADVEHIRQRYGREINLEELFEQRRPGGRVLTLDGHPHRGQPVVLSEFGGIAYDQRRTSGVKSVWGYSEVKTDRDFAQRYYRLLHVVVSSPLFSGFCYTQFADVFQEANGLLNSDRTSKIPLEEIRKATRLSRTYLPDVV